MNVDSDDDDVTNDGRLFCARAAATGICCWYVDNTASGEGQKADMDEPEPDDADFEFVTAADVNDSGAG